jgi:hypothetical protein
MNPTLIVQVQRALDLVSSVYKTTPRKAIAAGDEIIITITATGEVVGLIRRTDAASHERIVERLIDSLTGAV